MNLDVSNKFETPDFDKETKELFEVNVKKVIGNLVDDKTVKRSTAPLNDSGGIDMHYGHPAIVAKQGEKNFSFIFQSGNVTMFIGDKKIPNNLEVSRVNTKYASLLNSIKYQSTQVKDLTDSDPNKTLAIELLKDLIK